MAPGMRPNAKAFRGQPLDFVFGQVGSLLGEELVYVHPK